ncbi:unnamed protein product [Thlaspi arvense]|uniref:Uncharacterized protein n=1 Tax=Thlaspi arvense TaxID=13288 RepID=A0AAU9S741_THLAR|nr:unnamed protein product [Thlaspi arvense]
MAIPKKRKRSLTQEDEEAHERVEIDLNEEPNLDEEAHQRVEIDLNKEPELDEEAHRRVEIDLNKEPEIDEEAHQRVEIDLNKEPELDEEHGDDRAELNKGAATDPNDDVKQEEEEADLNKTVASEVKDADPRNRETTARRRSTPEEEKERDEQDEMVIAALTLCHIKYLSNTTRAENQPELRTKKREKESKDEDEDDSEQTLASLSRWETPLKPPGKIVNRRLIEQCSRPIRKQLTASDVRGDGDRIRLSLSRPQVRKKFLQFLGESEIPGGQRGAKVSVYGPDGKVHEMKMFPDDKKSPDSTSTTGWRKFVRDYELKEFCDFITIWMFKHKKTQQVCLAIDTKRLSVRKQVSKRISMAAFEDSD